jgi:probable HAF family extracellular repeat protein
MKTKSILAVVMVLVVAFVPISFSTAASFQGLGFLPGVDNSYAFAVSADGNVVVGYSENEAFRWTASEGIRSIGFLLAEYPIDYSIATGVSADGSVVVGEGKLEWCCEPFGPTYEAFYWTEAGGMQGLGVLPDSGYYYSSASGVSADGSVVVGSSKISNEDCAFRWTIAGGMVSLGDLPGGHTRSNASGVSVDGSVVVGSSESGSGVEAFRWTESEGMVGLGTLPASEALGVSADGSVIIGLSRHSSGGYEAFRWTVSEGMVGLGFLSVGGLMSAALGVSADGSVVVGFSESDPDFHEAFIWKDGFGMHPLKDVLESTYGLDLTGWTLTSAKGISANGLTIVGYGINPDGHYEAWVAMLEDPGPPVILTMNGEPNNIDTVSPNIGQHTYYQNAVVLASARTFVQCPDVYRFDHWEGDVTNLNSPSTIIIMDTDKTVTVVYMADERVCGDECHPILQGDLNKDCYINFADFAIYATKWLSCTHPDCD